MTALAILCLVLYALPQIVTGVSALFTAIHSVNEVSGRPVPIWEYLGLTDSYAVGLFGLAAFGALQVGLALHGYWLGDRWALWALLCVRLGDCVFSHWVPWAAKARPNPGLETTPLYALEAAWIALYLGGVLR